jgi:hypothetical protein
MRSIRITGRQKLSEEKYSLFPPSSHVFSFLLFFSLLTMA